MTSNALQLLESLLTEARDAISQVTPSPSYRYVADLAAAYRRVAGSLTSAAHHPTRVTKPVDRA